MSGYKLTYFPGKALGEPIRLLFAYGGQEYEDFRFKEDDWPQYKPKMPFGKVPVLEMEGKTLHQSIAITRYLAKKYQLTGADDWEALQCDIMVDTISDFRQALASMSYDENEASKEKKKGPLKAETIPFYLGKFDEIIAANGGYFVGGKLTWADLHWIGVVDYLASMMDQPSGVDFMAGHKHLLEHHAKVTAIPSIKAWIDKRPVTAY